MPLVLLVFDLVLHVTLLGTCGKCSFLTAVTLQMVLTTTVAIFRSISIGF